MGSDFGALIGLAVDTVSCMLFLQLYKASKAALDKIKGAKDVEIGPELTRRLQECEDGSIPYACVQGMVRPVDKALQSQFNPWQEGVVQRSIITEHKSKKVQGFWSDVKRVIRDSTQEVPFYLRNIFWKEEDGQSHNVYVMEPAEAEFLMGDLTSTYDKFEPNQASFMQRMTDRIFGDVHEGMQFSEEMLLCDTLLLGMGKVALVDEKIQLRPPASGYQYILTQITKAEVLRRFENRVQVFKVLAYITGIIGVGLSLYIIRKRYKKWKQERENEQFLAETRNARTERFMRNVRAERADGNQNNHAGDDNSCVVCLTNARDVIMLNCGHICTCAECTVVLPRPMLCPVCRQPVNRYLPVYNP